MTLETSITHWANLFTQTAIFDSAGGYIISLAICFISALAISPNKFSNMKTLMFPIMIGYKLLGFNIPLVFIALGGIIFIIETLSLQVIGGFIGTVKEKVAGIEESGEILARKVSNKERKEKAILTATDREQGLGLFGRLTKEQKKILKLRNNSQIIPIKTEEMPFTELPDKVRRYSKLKLTNKKKKKEEEEMGVYTLNE